MRRRLPLLVAVLACADAGCAGTTDTLTSRRFRKDPFNTLFRPGDPQEVMRTSTEGDRRAAAMRRLKEPAKNGRPGEQDEAIEMLSQAATSDPSPVVRVAAIDALSRFEDERAVQILTAAYHQASGGPRKPVPAPLTRQANAADPDDPAALAERFNLNGPSGFPGDVSNLIRARAVTALAQTGRAEAVPLLTHVATGADEGSAADRDTRLAAVRGLSQVRTGDSVVALAKVLSAENGKDPALASRAHQGLKGLTGQPHPADPETWDAVVRGGTFEVQPPANVIQQVAGWVTDD